MCHLGWYSSVTGGQSERRPQGNGPTGASSMTGQGQPTAVALASLGLVHRWKGALTGGGARDQQAWASEGRQWRLAGRAGDSPGDGKAGWTWLRNKECSKHPDKSSSLKRLAGTMMLEFKGVQFEAQKRIGTETFNRHLWMKTRGSNSMWYQYGNLVSEN